MADNLGNKYHETLSKFLSDLKQRSYEGRLKRARDLRIYIENESRSRSPDAFTAFVTDVNKLIMDLIHSPDPVEKLGGVLVLNELIEVPYEETEVKIIRYGGYLRIVLYGDSTNFQLLQVTATAFGHLASAGGTLATDVMVTEARRGLEILRSPDKSDKWVPALLILKELAENAPTVFSMYLDSCIDSLWPSLHSTNDVLRDCALATLRQCILLVNTRLPSQREQLYTRINTEILGLFKLNTADAIQGGLRSISLLLANGGDFLAPYLTKVIDLVLHHKDHRERTVRDTVVMLIPIMVSYSPSTFSGSSFYLKVFTDHILSTLHKAQHDVSISIAYISLGKLSLHVGEALLAKLDVIANLIKDGLRNKHRKATHPAVFACLSMLSRSLGLSLLSYATDLVDLLFDGGLSHSLVSTLSELAQNLPVLLPSIQSRLLSSISLILTQHDASSTLLERTQQGSLLRAATGLIQAGVTQPTDDTDDGKSTNLILLALDTLGSFNFVGHNLLTFVYEHVLPWLSAADAKLRARTARCCLNIVLRPPTNPVKQHLGHYQRMQDLFNAIKQQLEVQQQALLDIAAQGGDAEQANSGGPLTAETDESWDNPSEWLAKRRNTRGLSVSVGRNLLLSAKKDFKNNKMMKSLAEGDEGGSSTSSSPSTLAAGRSLHISGSIASNDTITSLKTPDSLIKVAQQLKKTGTYTRPVLTQAETSAADDNDMIWNENMLHGAGTEDAGVMMFKRLLRVQFQVLTQLRVQIELFISLQRNSNHVDPILPANLNITTNSQYILAQIHLLQLQIEQQQQLVYQAQKSDVDLSRLKSSPIFDHIRRYRRKIRRQRTASQVAEVPPSTTKPATAATEVEDSRLEFDATTLIHAYMGSGMSLELGLPHTDSMHAHPSQNPVSAQLQVTYTRGIANCALPSLVSSSMPNGTAQTALIPDEAIPGYSQFNNAWSSSREHGHRDHFDIEVETYDASCQMATPRGWTTMVSEILARLTATTVSDPEPAIRQNILSLLNPSFDMYLAQPQHLTTLMNVLKDTNVDNKKAVLNIFSRLMTLNPVLVFPILRHTMIEVLHQLQLSTLARVREDNASILTHIMTHCHTFIKPYSVPILKVLVRVAMTADHPSVIASVLTTIGETVLVAGYAAYPTILPILPVLFTILHNKESHTSSATAKTLAAITSHHTQSASPVPTSLVTKQQAAASTSTSRYAGISHLVVVRCLRLICSACGLAITPYKIFPPLLSTLVRIVSGTLSTQTRSEAIQLIGVIGAIDPLAAKTLRGKGNSQPMHEFIDEINRSITILRARNPSVRYDPLTTMLLGTSVEQSILDNEVLRMLLQEQSIELERRLAQHHFEYLKSNAVHVTQGQQQTLTYQPRHQDYVNTLVNYYNSAETATTASPQESSLSTYELNLSEFEFENDDILAMIAQFDLNNTEQAVLDAAPDADYHQYAERGMKSQQPHSTSLAETSEATQNAAPLPEITVFDPSQDLALSQEANYRLTAIRALCEILLDPSQSQQHIKAVTALIFIFKTYGADSYRLCPHIVPALIHCLSSGDDLLRRFIIEQLGVIALITTRHFHIYIAPILQFILQHWTTLINAMPRPILSLIHRLSHADINEVQIYIPQILPLLLSILQHDKSQDRVLSREALRALQAIGYALEPYLHMTLPALINVWALGSDSPLFVRCLSLHTTAQLIRTVSSVQHTPRLILPLLELIQSCDHIVTTTNPSTARDKKAAAPQQNNVAGGTTEEGISLLNEALQTLAVIIYHLGPLFAKHILTTQSLLNEKNITHDRVSSLFHKVLSQVPLTRSDAPPPLPCWANDNDSYTIHEDLSRMFPMLYDEAWGKELGLNRSLVVVAGPHGEIHPQKLTVNQSALVKAWDASQRISSDDWNEWMKGVCVQLLKESPFPPLRACSGLAQKDYILSQKLFTVGFASCWDELSDNYQDAIINSLDLALKSPSTPTEVLSTLLMVCEFMEHSDRSLPLDIRHLAHLSATKCHSFAKALHYKEQEYHTSSQPALLLEDLISTHNKLQQPQAAIGILKMATSLPEFKGTLQENWYEQLHRWDQALAAYERKQLTEALASGAVDDFSEEILSNGGRERFSPHGGSIVGSIIGSGHTYSLASSHDISAHHTIKVNGVSIETILGRLRCLKALGDHQRVANTAIDLWNVLQNMFVDLQSRSYQYYQQQSSNQQQQQQVGNTTDQQRAAVPLPLNVSYELALLPDIISEVASLASGSLHMLGRWDDLPPFFNALSPQLLDRSFYQAIYSIHKNDLPTAEKHLQEARRLVQEDVLALLGEGYTRAYYSIVGIQLLNELDEVLIFKRLGGDLSMPYVPVLSHATSHDHAMALSKMRMVNSSESALIGVDPLYYRRSNTEAEQSHAYSRLGNANSPSQQALPADAYFTGTLHGSNSIHRHLFDSAHVIYTQHHSRMFFNHISQPSQACPSTLLTPAFSWTEVLLRTHQRAMLRSVWTTRLKHAQRNVFVWRHLLAIQSLVLRPNQNTRQWILFSQMCGRQGRLDTSLQIMESLIGRSPHEPPMEYAVHQRYLKEDPILASLDEGSPLSLALTHSSPPPVSKSHFSSSSQQPSALTTSPVSLQDMRPQRLIYTPSPETLLSSIAATTSDTQVSSVDVFTTTLSNVFNMNYAPSATTLTAPKSGTSPSSSHSQSPATTPGFGPSTPSLQKTTSNLSLSSTSSSGSRAKSAGGASSGATKQFEFTFGVTGTLSAVANAGIGLGGHGFNVDFTTNPHLAIGSVAVSPVTLALAHYNKSKQLSGQPADQLPSLGRTGSIITTLKPSRSAAGDIDHITEEKNVAHDYAPYIAYLCPLDDFHVGLAYSQHLWRVGYHSQALDRLYYLTHVLEYLLGNVSHQHNPTHHDTAAYLEILKERNPTVTITEDDLVQHKSGGVVYIKHHRYCTHHPTYAKNSQESSPPGSPRAGSSCHSGQASCLRTDEGYEPLVCLLSTCPPPTCTKEGVKIDPDEQWLPLVPLRISQRRELLSLCGKLNRIVGDWSLSLLSSVAPSFGISFHPPSSLADLDLHQLPRAERNIPQTLALSTTLEAYQRATLLSPNRYKGFHGWAVVHYRASQILRFTRQNVSRVLKQTKTLVEEQMKSPDTVTEVQLRSQHDQVKLLNNDLDSLSKHLHLHVVASITGFLRSIALSRDTSESLQDLLRLLALWFAHADIPSRKHTFGTTTSSSTTTSVMPSAGAMGMSSSSALLQNAASTAAKSAAVAAAAAAVAASPTSGHAPSSLQNIPLQQQNYIDVINIPAQVLGQNKLPAVADVLRSGFKSLSVTTWVVVSPQIIARLHSQSAKGPVRALIHELLITVGRVHPQALVYPLTVAAKSEQKSSIQTVRQHVLKVSLHRGLRLYGPRLDASRHHRPQLHSGGIGGDPLRGGSISYMETSYFDRHHHGTESHVNGDMSTMAQNSQFMHTAEGNIATLLGSTSSATTNTAISVMAALRTVSPLLVEQAMVVSRELIRAAVLWHEIWHEALEEASQLWFGQQDAVSMLAVLLPLHYKIGIGTGSGAGSPSFRGQHRNVVPTTTQFPSDSHTLNASQSQSLVNQTQHSYGPETPREVAFVHLFGRELAIAHDWCMRYLTRIAGEFGIDPVGMWYDGSYSIKEKRDLEGYQPGVQFYDPRGIPITRGEVLIDEFLDKQRASRAEQRAWDIAAVNQAPSGGSADDSSSVFASNTIGKPTNNNNNIATASGQYHTNNAAAADKSTTVATTTTTTTGTDKTDKTPPLVPYESDINQAWAIYCNVFKALNIMITGADSSKSFELHDVSPMLLACHNLVLSIPGAYNAENDLNTVRIVRVVSHFKIIESKQRPRRLCIIGSDGNEHPFLLKGHEDLRQDTRVMQLFDLVNALLSSTSSVSSDVNTVTSPLDQQDSFSNGTAHSTSGMDLNIRGYSVTPLSPVSGVIQWLSNCDTMHALIKDYREARFVLLNTEHRLMLQFSPDFQSLTSIQKVEVFEHALANTSGRDLADVLWLKASNSEQWLERRSNYTRSLAVTSIVGYILGLGDRHPCNVMLDRATGKILHIDFGDCFEVAQHRDKFPERVPFRLTRMLIRALEVSGVEGSFRLTCEFVMNTLRQSKESVMAVLEAFIYDPLITWKLVGQATKEDDLEQDADGGHDASLAKDKDGGSQSELASGRTLAFHRSSTTMAAGGKPSAPISLAKQIIFNEILHSIVDDVCEDENVIFNPKAIAVIDRVQSKLDGTDFDVQWDYTSQQRTKRLIKDETPCIIGWGLDSQRFSLHMTKSGAPLSATEQVELLVREATSSVHLAQCYIGWCSFW